MRKLIVKPQCVNKTYRNIATLINVALSRCNEHHNVIRALK